MASSTPGKERSVETLDPGTALGQVRRRKREKAKTFLVSPPKIQPQTVNLSGPSKLKMATQSMRVASSDHLSEPRQAVLLN
jgi:hypothetical protein